MAAEQVGVRLEELEHFGEAAGGEVVIAADARALLEMDGRGEAVRGEHLVRDLERLLEADWPAQALRADPKSSAIHKLLADYPILWRGVPIWPQLAFADCP